MANDYPACGFCGERHKVCEPTELQKAGLEYIETPLSEQKLFIPHRLDGLNDLIDAARSHWSNGAKQKREQEEIVMWAIKKCSLKPIRNPFRMEIFFAEPNTARDPDNITSAKKYILDALQKMKIIPNDNQKYVLGWTENWGLADNKRPVGVHIKLIEEISNG